MTIAVFLFTVGLACLALAWLVSLIADGARVAEEWALSGAAWAAWRA